MGLKIDKLCENSLRGTLDGMIPVRGDIKEGKIRIVILDWIYTISDDLISGVSGLRYAVYAALAKYRDERKNS